MKSYISTPTQNTTSYSFKTKTEKVWGIEEELSHFTRDKFTCKIMTIFPYGQVSVHLHRNKSEEFILLEGELIVETINTNTCERTITHLQNKFDNITIESMTPHTFYCPKGQKVNTVFMEVSTPDFASDSYRFEPSKVYQ